MGNILTLKEQYALTDGWLGHRLETLLPQIMRENDVDMWIILAKEYNEDPVFMTLVPALEKTASRLSCLVFSRDGGGKVEALSLCRPDPLLERYYKRAWDGRSESQWECLRRIVEEKNPARIGINLSESFALADGLTKTLYDLLANELGSAYRPRLVSAEKLCIGWLERRSAPELEAYPSVYKIAEEIIGEAFSSRVIEAGKTTTGDVEWWMMEKIHALGLAAWFTPTIDLQRKGIEDRRLSDILIQPGDLLHCDMGVRYLGLCTDTQRLAYVLKSGEQGVPAGIRAALKQCNGFQNIVTGNMTAGRTGNEVLAASLEEARRQGVKAMLYTHPIGCHGHGAGPLIGLWDNQEQVPGRGDYPLCSDTCYALELNTAAAVPEWDGQEVSIFLEETVALTGSGVHYLGQRQEEILLI